MNFFIYQEKGQEQKMGLNGRQVIWYEVQITFLFFLIDYVGLQSHQCIYPFRLEKVTIPISKKQRKQKKKAYFDEPQNIIRGCS